MSWEALLDVDGNILQDADGNPLVSPYGPKKRDVIKRAYAMCGRSLMEGELDADDYYAGLLFLNDVAAEIEGSWGIAIGYQYPDANFDGSPEDESGLPRNAIAAVAGEVAMLLAMKMGKTISALFLKRQGKAIAALVSRGQAIPQMQMARGTPRGAGSRTRISRFFVTDISDAEPIQ